MALKHFVLGGKNIGYSDTGAGAETIILIHCSGASHRIFAELIEALSVHYRVLAPDLAGYGVSESWPVNESFHFKFDVNIIKRLISLSRTPVHLVGYSYGGFLALETALICPEIRSLVLFEPVALQILRECDNPRLQKEVQTMGARLIKYAKAGQSRRAAKTYISYWGGYWRWLLMPRRYKNAVQRSVSKTAMEFASGYDSATDLEQYQRITCPVLFVGGSHTRETAKTVIHVLNQSLEHSQCKWLKGATHLTLLRQSNVNDMVMEWLTGAKASIDVNTNEKALEFS